MEEARAEAKLERFLQWLQVNGVELRSCEIRYCGPTKGFGIFSADDSGESNGILLVVPLDLAITPMRVLQDPTLGPKCRAMFEEGDVDDRFLMILFLTVEHVRKDSSWKPYLDMLPTTFGNPLWFTNDELSELKGTTLHRATELQKKNLRALFDNKVKRLLEELLPLDGESEREASFEDFLWANSIFWTRALNIPFPRTYVFPQVPGVQENGSFSLNKDFGAPLAQISGEMSSHGEDERGSQFCRGEQEVTENQLTSTQPETIWVEGLVPGIDFCNHDLKAAATWEVDETGSTTGVPSSMYLLSADQNAFQIEKEICISYGNKGNEELLYLYGFVIDNNPDDYLMVHYPMEAFQSVPLADSKAQLLEIQKAEMRSLLPRSLLDHGFFSGSPLHEEDGNKNSNGLFCNYSWSGQRKAPSYLNKLVFPEDFLTALRTIAMQESELLEVTSLLEELVGSGEERQPSDTEVRAAVWEACGDSGALQLLVDLLSVKIMELEEGSGTDASDTELLEKAFISERAEDVSKNVDHHTGEKEQMSRNRWSSIVYRRGQKQLTRMFLKEAEHALQLCLKLVAGGTGTGAGTKNTAIVSDKISVSFDVQTLYIPPLTGSTTRFLGLPLPPFLKIDILPELFQGTIDEETGQVDLEFRAKFLFSVGSIYRAPPLLVSTVLTSEESRGKIKGGRGKRLDGQGKCRLVGVATVDPISDLLMDSFLGLPTECLADLNAIISISTST